MPQEELPLFLTREDGTHTVSHLTLAFRLDGKGGQVIDLVVSPGDDQWKELTWHVTPRHDVQAIISMVTAHIAGRLVRDFTRQGRFP